MLANSSISLFCIVGAISIALLLAIMVIRWLRKETVITDHLPCNLSETGSMVYYAKHTSGDGDNKYCFNFRKTNNAWLAYIVRIPDERGCFLASNGQKRDGNRQEKRMAQNCLLQKVQSFRVQQ